MAFDFEKQSHVLHLSIDDQARAHFLEMIRWARFLGILSAVMMVVFSILLMIGISASSAFSGFDASGSTAAIIVFLVVLAGIYFYPIYALIRFGTYIRNGLNNQDQPQFNRGVKMLSSFFKYIGILAIIMIVIYGLIFAVALAFRPS